nr:MAG TPA: hypothetical protein [Caudoviricetes sp.]
MVTATDMKTIEIVRKALEGGAKTKAKPAFCKPATRFFIKPFS